MLLIIGVSRKSLKFRNDIHHRTLINFVVGNDRNEITLQCIHKKHKKNKRINKYHILHPFNFIHSFYFIYLFIYVYAIVILLSIVNFSVSVCYMLSLTKYLNHYYVCMAVCPLWCICPAVYVSKSCCMKSSTQLNLVSFFIVLCYAVIVIVKISVVVLFYYKLHIFILMLFNSIVCVYKATK